MVSDLQMDGHYLDVRLSTPREHARVAGNYPSIANLSRTHVPLHETLRVKPNLRIITVLVYIFSLCT
jgi:hypothetical protein